MKVRQGLKYDPDKELGLGNYPKILFDKTLTHTIKSISRYARDGKGKLTEDWKHFMDVVRYDQMSCLAMPTQKDDTYQSFAERFRSDR